MTADELEALDDRPASEVAIPEWGGLKVRLQPLTVEERDQVVFDSRELIAQGKHIGPLRLRVLARSIIGPGGTPIFAGDFERGERILAKKCPNAIDALWELCEQQNGLGDKQARVPN